MPQYSTDIRGLIVGGQRCCEAAAAEVSTKKRGVTRSPQAPSSPCHATKLTDFRQSITAMSAPSLSDPDRHQREMRKHRSVLYGVKLRKSEILFPLSPLYSRTVRASELSVMLDFAGICSGHLFRVFPSRRHGFDWPETVLGLRRKTTARRTGLSARNSYPGNSVT